MEEKIRLTIAIPTYNRCELLLQTLNSVEQQRVGGVEVIVSDNASTDDAEGKVKKYCREHNIIYHRNAENLGMDANFLNCLQMAKGEYIHLLSDDDILLPGAIEKILMLIEEEQPDYINLNSYTYAEKVFDVTKKGLPRITLRTEGGTDFISTDKNACMKYIGVYITYISATILKRKNFEEIKKPSKYYGTYFLHAHCVFECLKGDNKKIVITKETWVAAKWNNSGGFNLYEVWVREYKKLLLGTAVKCGFDYKLMEKMYVGDINGFIKDSILKYSIEEAYDMSNKSILFHCTYHYPSVWFRAWPMAVLPRSILKIIYDNRRKKRAAKKEKESNR